MCSTDEDTHHPLCNSTYSSDSHMRLQVDPKQVVELEAGARAEGVCASCQPKKVGGGGGGSCTAA